MSRFQVAVHIVPRRGILDPQGKAVADALNSLGFAGVNDVHVGRHNILELDAADAFAADAMTRKMCQKLLANPDASVRLAAAKAAFLRSC